MVLLLPTPINSNSPTPSLQDCLSWVLMAPTACGTIPPCDHQVPSLSPGAPVTYQAQHHWLRSRSSKWQWALSARKEVIRVAAAGGRSGLGGGQTIYPINSSQTHRFSSAQFLPGPVPTSTHANSFFSRKPLIHHVNERNRSYTRELWKPQLDPKAAV
jgi:hypothetical protein